MKEHVSDVFVNGKGKDFLDALSSCLNQICLIIKQESKMKKNEERLFECRFKFYQNDLERTVVDGINDFLFFIETNHIIPISIKKIEKNNDEIVILFLGREGMICNPIKAATYHNLEIKKQNGFWEISVLLDV